jgi:glycosidase
MKRVLAWIMMIAILLSFAGCGTKDTGKKDTTGKYPLDEKRNEAVINDAGKASDLNVGNANIFYQIFVGSFSDSNGDGTGDLRGIINRMDYLNDGNPDSGVSLGIEGIWLSPIFISPTYHKYDTSDYYKIDPKFGTMEDLKELVDLCHARGVKVILDLVINHTSTQHPWFKAFTEAHRSGNTADKYYNYYSWAVNAGNPGTWRNISGSADYYECNFSGEMPELNYDNEEVRQEMVALAKYYLDLGVDGFRFDAAKYIYYGQESRNVEFWNWYMAELRKIKPDIYSVAEVWDSDGVTIPYFSSTNCFNFSMAQVEGKISQTAKAGDVNALTSYVADYIAQIKGQNPNAFPVTFIANHDTDRAAGFLTVASGHAKMAANLSILMPGSTFIYYGEEIGLKGSRGGANTDANRRLSMFWGDDDTVKDPIGSTYDSARTNGSVAEQKPNGDSLYNHYKKLIMIRKANPEIACGTYEPLVVEGSKAGGFLSTHEGKSVAVLHNTSMSAVQIDLSQFADATLTKIVAIAGAGAKLEGTVLTIEGQTSVVLR